jgi:tol-pal system protein YbgF
MMKTAGAGLQWGSLGLLMILTLTGCAADHELAVIRNDLDRMNRQLLQLQVAQEVGRTKPRELVQQEMEGERRNIADLKAGLDELKQQLGVLAERVDESGHRLNQRMSTLEAKLAAGAPQTLTGTGPSPSSSAQTPAPTASPGPAGQAPGSTPATAPASPEAKRLYQAALGDYQRGKFDLAAQGFRAYLQQAPNGDVADTAQYYLAESLYSAKDYRNAIAEFERLVRDFPQSPQVPGALLKAGYAYYEIKDGTQGRRALRTLIEKYPLSREAKLAEERLRLEERAGSSRPAPGSPSATSRPPTR